MQPLIKHSGLKILFLLFTISLLIISTSQAQSAIHGRILFSDNAPAVNTSVLLLQAKDSLLIKAMVCDKKGTYFFGNAVDGNYIIAINHVGYRQAYSAPFNINKINHDIAVADIIMTELPASLKEVTVTVRKPLLEQKIDRLIINVENSITAAGNTALEVLERSPGVIVDHQNHLISMNGKDGVELMINGKLSHMPMEAAVQMLAGMSSANIEKIELITTPPASFDAGGNAGYINIVLKENNNYGTNGSYSASLGYGKGLVEAASINVNHRQGKINIYGDLSYSRIKKAFSGNGYSKIFGNNVIKESYFNLDRTDTTINLNGRLGMDIEVSRRTTLGVLFSGYKNTYTQAEKNRNTILVNGETDTVVTLANFETNAWSNYAANLNIQHIFKEDEKVLINLDHIHYSNHQPVNYHRSYFDILKNLIYEEYLKSGKQTPINFWVAAVDYSKKLSGKISMEAGVKETVSAFSSNISLERLQGGVYVPEKSYSDKYKLNEDYTAAYVSLGIKLNKNTEAKTGLRFEHTNSNLGTAVLKNIVDRHYANAFPAVFISHKLDDNNAMNFSYSMRIRRPALTDLAPFTYFADNNTLLTGNPSLQPSFSNIVKGDYIFKKYLLSVSYTKEDHAITMFQPSTDSVTFKTILTPQNLENQKTISLVISLPVNVTKWWTMQYNITGIWQQINALYKNLPIRLSQANVNIYGSQSFMLPKKFSLELSGFYQSASLSGIFKSKGLGTLDIGLKKKLSQKNSLVFNASNILNTLQFRGGTNLPEQNLIGNIRIQFSQPTFKLTYSQNFGKEKLKEKRSYATGAEEEKGRVQ